MNSKMMLSITLGLLMLVGTASAASTSVPETNIQANNTTFGSYSYDLSSGGLVSNLGFTANQNYTLLINTVSVNGSSILNISAAGNMAATQSGLDKVQIHNATLYTQEQLSAIAFVTYSNITGTSPKVVSAPNITFNMNDSLTEINLVPNSNFSGPFGDYLAHDLKLQMDQNWSLFRIDNSIFSGYLFTNGNITLSNNDKTASIEGTNNRLSTSGTPFSILVAGLISSGDLNHYMDTYMYQHQNFKKFTYNSVTGLVSGQYVSFTFNSHTGVITNLVSKLTNSSQLFASITATGNGSMGTPFFLPYLPLDQVRLFGSIFFFANNSYTYGIHNNPTIQMSMLLNNGTMQFELPSTMAVTNLSRPYGSNSGLNLSALVYDTDQYGAIGLGTTNRVLSGSSTLMIHNSNVKAFITVNGGQAVYNTSNHIISVTSSDLAIINFVMPPGLNNLSSADFQDLQYAYEHGNLAGQISCDYLNGTPTNYSFLYNNSLDFKFLGESPGQVHFRASSNQSQGTNLAFYVNKTYLNSSVNLQLFVNGELASKAGNFNDVLNSTGSTPTYAFIATQNGYMVLLHIPHFTVYNITIAGAPAGSTGTPIWEIAALAVSAVAVVAIIVYALVRRK